MAPQTNGDAGKELHLHLQHTGPSAAHQKEPIIKGYAMRPGVTFLEQDSQEEVPD